MTNRSNLYHFIDESNAIEGIFNIDPAIQIPIYEKILNNKNKCVLIDDLEKFVMEIQPGAQLRTQFGMDVQVGNHVAPCGGMQITYMLNGLLNDMYSATLHPYQAHLYYEWLHPFMDGNGRSGRMLYYKYNRGTHGLTFKHNWYYETLRFSGIKNPTPKEYFDTKHFEGD